MLSSTEILIKLATGAAVSQADALWHLHHVTSCARSEVIREENHSRRKFRDASLLEAAALLRSDETPLWSLAGRLENAVKRFETRVWPRLRVGLVAGDLSPVDVALYKAFLTGEQVPTTQRRLYDLLT
jgi:hypothetical protein